MRKPIEKVNGNVIRLWMPSFENLDKKDSLFIYDEQIGMWCLKSEYDKLNKEEDDFSRCPMLSHNQLDNFGIWKLEAEAEKV